MTRAQTRDPATGQFAHDGDMTRICTCGHALGMHLHGGFDCINSEVGDGSPCGCLRFRQSRRRTEQA